MTAEALAAEAAPDVRAQSVATLAKHGRSFRLAGRLLDPERLDDAALLYAFCRVADDAVDNAQSPEAAHGAVGALREQLLGQRPADELLAGFRKMALRRRMPIAAAFALLDAVETDVGTVRIADDRALLRYAYGVAGTVGLMMAALLGGTDPRAAAPAIDLGIGMQLSNIARDVAEDARLGRVYLPATRLRAAGVDPEAIVRGDADPARVTTVVAELLDLAERYYRSADGGLRHLPYRSRLTVLAAGRLYRAIGRKVRRRGVAALVSRTVVGAVEKAAWVAVAVVLSWWPPGRFGPAEHDPSLHTAIADLPGAAG